MAGKKSAKRASRGHRHTLSLQKTEVVINVYDLLPPGKLSTLLWTVGSSLLHSGVVVNGKEYAYGGHDQRGLTGVYWTQPKTDPPGGTYRCEVLQGFTLAPQEEIDAIIKKASEAFHGTAYNILNRNCNHFTSYLCQELTGRPGPTWLNRAASIGIALPCIVPKDWIAAPDFETSESGLLDEEDDYSDERSRMLRRHSYDDDEGYDEAAAEAWENDMRRSGDSRKGKASVRDTSGRAVPPADRAPVPRSHGRGSSE